jgi:hypothetical protein
MARATAFLLMLCTAQAVTVQPRAADVAALPGLIVDERSVARDATGAPDEARIPGARAWRGPDPAVAARRAELEAERDAAAATAPGAAAVMVAPLPGDGRAPSRGLRRSRSRPPAQPRATAGAVRKERPMLAARLILVVLLGAAPRTPTPALARRPGRRGLDAVHGLAQAPEANLFTDR